MMMFALLVLGALTQKRRKKNEKKICVARSAQHKQATKPEK
jgi:hypothetical protein